MTKKKVTLSIDADVYDAYSEFCDENGFIVSKKVELFMKKEIEDAGKKK